MAALAASGRLPDPVPVGAGTAGVQIVDDQGRVVAVSAGADRLTALIVPSAVRAARQGEVLVIDGARLGTPDTLRVVGYPVPPGRGRPAGQTVLVAVSEAEATGSVRALGFASADRRAGAAGRLRRRLLAARRALAAAGLPPAARSRGDRGRGVGRRAAPARAAGPGRGTPPGRDSERHARPAGGRGDGPAGVRRRRRARAAQPADRDPDPARGGPSPPRVGAVGRDGGRRAGRHRPAGPAGRRPAAARSGRRRR